MAEGKLQGEMSNPAVEISNNARLESDPHSHTSTTPGSLSSPRKFCCHSFCASLPDKDNACLVDDNPHFIRFPQPCLDYRLAKLGSKFRKCHKVFECYNCDLAARWIHNCGGTFLNTIDDISSNTFICSKHFKSVEDAQLFKEDPSPATSELQQSFEPICIKLSTLNCAQTLPKTNGECSSGPRVWPTMSNQHCQPTSDVSTTTDNNNRSTNSGMNKNSRFNYWKEYYKSPDTGETNMCNVEATILKKIEDLTRLTTGACPNLPLCLPTLEPLKTSAQINSTRVCCFDQCNSRSDQLVATSAEKSFCFIKFPQPCYYYRRTVTNYGSLLKSHVRCDQCDLAARWLIMCGRKRGLVKLGDIKSTTYICSKHFNSVENAQLYKEDPKSEMGKETLPLAKLENHEISVLTLTETSPSTCIVSSPLTSFETRPSACIETSIKTCVKRSSKANFKTSQKTRVTTKSRTGIKTPRKTRVKIRQETSVTISSASKVNSSSQANVGTSRKWKFHDCSRISVIGDLYDSWAELNNHSASRTSKKSPNKRTKGKCLDRSQPMMIDEGEWVGKLPVGDQPVDFYLNKSCCYGTCTSRRFVNNRQAEKNDFFIRFPQPCVDYRMAARGSDIYKFHRMFGCDKCRLAERWVQMCGRQSFTIDDITFNTYICAKHFHSAKNAELYREDPFPAKKCAKRGRPPKEKMSPRTVNAKTTNVKKIPKPFSFGYEAELLMPSNRNFAVDAIGEIQLTSSIFIAPDEDVFNESEEMLPNASSSAEDKQYDSKGVRYSVKSEQIKTEVASNDFNASEVIDISED